MGCRSCTESVLGSAGGEALITRRPHKTGQATCFVDPVDHLDHLFMDSLPGAPKWLGMCF
jgi:hypothetical protein